MKELDLLLARYVDERFATASAVDQAAFHWLLDAQDPEIYGYFVGREIPPHPAVAALVERITGRVA